MKKKFGFWYILKTSFVIFIFASLIHSLYDITKLEFLKPFVPINESIWEHLKMMFYAGFIYGIIECFCGYKKYDNFLVARGTANIIITFLVPIVYYVYTYFTGKGYLWVDILNTFIISIVGQLIFRYLLTSDKKLKQYSFIVIVFNILVILIFAYFTYYPLKLKIFIPHS
ncbi:DUF6512 family protein [Clostridiaceae bacterium M8S5]|nr:DUF6512 family protein [Clostridiaceae bacterium M8S5]